MPNSQRYSPIITACYAHYLINGQIYIRFYFKKITALLLIILTCLFRIHYNHKLLYKRAESFHHTLYKPRTPQILRFFIKMY